MSHDPHVASFAYLPSLLSLGELSDALGDRTGRPGRQAVARLLGDIEEAVALAPQDCLAFDGDGQATLAVGGTAYAAGRFATPTLADLRTRVDALPRTEGGDLRLSILHGAHVMTDIGTLQATAPAGTLFQVASQFDCLEAPGPAVVPVQEYVYDNTQGPRASVSAFPGTFLRHYAAPDGAGGRFVQSNERCLDLLADVCDESVATVQRGYLQPHHIHDAAALARALEERFDQVRIGLHEEVEVVFGHDWDGPVPAGKQQRIAQVFTSTIALGGYGHFDEGADDGAAFVTIRRQLLRAAYLGTLLAAVATGQRRVVLTMIGGGVFGNPHRDIWDAIHAAGDNVRPLLPGPLNVFVNTREEVDPGDREAAWDSGGVVVEFTRNAIKVRRGPDERSRFG